MRELCECARLNLALLPRRAATKAFGGGILDSWAATVETNQTLAFFTDMPTMGAGLFSAVPVGLGSWRHVAVRWDGARSQILLDGAVIADRAITGLAWDDSRISVGGEYEFGAPIALYAGRLDDLRIFQRALSDSEIAEIFNER